MKTCSFIFVALYCVCCSVQAYSERLFENHTFGDQSSVLVVAADSSARSDLFAWQADKLLIPASTLKLVTAQLALEKWGAEHQFYTDFFLADGWLWVKGYGDPFLVSEELAVIVQALKPYLPQQALKGIAIDASYFASNDVPGRGRSNDPYNAPLSAVAVNFNTVFLRLRNGVVTSAEVQTPLTPTAKSLAAGLTAGKHRINLKSAALGQQHFAETLSIMLRQQQVDIGTQVQIRQVPAGAQRLYRHYNSRTLADNLRGSLEFSNNFIANQLFILLGETGASPVDGVLSLQHTSRLLPAGIRSMATPSTVKPVGQFMSRWQEVVIQEGAGLSRGNRLSARHLLDTLIALEDYQYLLRSYEGGKVRAKTGTLRGVRTFAGYLTLAEQRYYFVFLFNEPMPFRFRDVLLKEMISRLGRKR